MAGLMAVADERTGRIVLIGSAQGLREAERVIKELDLPSRTENFHVYKLHNADAKTVAEQLSQILATAAKLSPDKEGAVPSTVVPTSRRTASSSPPRRNSTTRLNLYSNSSTRSRSR